MIRYGFAEKIGDVIEFGNCFSSPYKAYDYNSNYGKLNNNLCIVKNTIVIKVLETPLISVKWVMACANRLLPIYETKYPKDKKLRKLLETALVYFENPEVIDISKVSRDARKIWSKSEMGIVAGAAYTVYSTIKMVINPNPIDAFQTISNSHESKEDVEWKQNKLTEIIKEYEKEIVSNYLNVLNNYLPTELSLIIIDYKIVILENIKETKEIYMDEIFKTHFHPHEDITQEEFLEMLTPDLIEINMSGCEFITHIPELPNLLYLYCSGCLLTSIPQLDNLEILDCSNCPNLISISENLPKLEDINCSDCPSLLSLTITDFVNLQASCFDENLRIRN